MKPIASFGPTTSITFSPMTISMVPDCTMYMHCPGSPLLNTTLPFPKFRFAPALFANWRMSIVWPFMAASLEKAGGCLASIYPAEDLRIFRAA